MKRNFVIMVLILAAAAAVIYNQTGKVIPSFTAAKPLPTEKGAKAGLLAPDFTLKGLDGQTYSGGGSRDKVLLINFWASWCDPCKQEAPELAKLIEKYPDDFEVYGINVTKYDQESKARDFVKEYGLEYPIMLDPEASVFEEIYKGQVFPTNVLIDRNGVIQEIILGAPEPEYLEKTVRKWIAS